jgi:hypothetical protein
VTDALRRLLERFLLPVLLACFAASLAIGVADVASGPWRPTADLAETELKVRDTLSAHPPLIGLGGRIGDFGPRRGSHPGPLSFYVLSPVYRLFGATPTGLLVATAASNLAAVACTLWLVGRRAGRAAVLGTAVVLAALAAGYGKSVLLIPWNPHLPVLWWVAFVLAAWSVTCDDWRAFPVVVFAGTFGLQTHVPYAVIIGTVSATTAVIVTARWRRSRGTEPPSGRRRWLIGGLVLGALLWAPPVIDQLTAEDGNLAKLVRHFSSTDEEVQGYGMAMRQLLAMVNPVSLLGGEITVDGLLPSRPLLPGVLALVAWATSAVVAWRTRLTELVRLHLLVGAALVGAFVALSRIFGLQAQYLALWAWGINALVVVGIGWTVVALAARRGPARPWAGQAVATLAVVAIVAYLGVLAVRPAPAPAIDERRSRIVTTLAAPTAARLAEGSLPGTGRDGRYRLTVDDAAGVGLPHLGLLNELERRGFSVGLDPSHVAAISAHRLVETGTATARLHLASGSEVELARRFPVAVEVASMERALTTLEEYELTSLRAQVGADLRSRGRTDLIAEIDRDPGALASDTDLDADVRSRLGRIVDIERSAAPIALFVLPPDGPAPAG